MLVNTHLTFPHDSDHDPAMRREQARKLSELIRDQSSPTVLFGDMNTPSEADAAIAEITGLGGCRPQPPGVRRRRGRRSGRQVVFTRGAYWRAHAVRPGIHTRRMQGGRVVPRRERRSSRRARTPERPPPASCDDFEMERRASNSTRHSRLICFMKRRCRRGRVSVRGLRCSGYRERATQDRRRRRGAGGLAGGDDCGGDTGVHASTRGD